jgi:hypothetical protein
MKRSSKSVLAVTLFAFLAVVPALAFAQDMPPAEHKSIGLGFHNDSAPIGVRWWFAGQKVGLDLGVGYDREAATTLGFPFPDEHLSKFTINAGIPIVLKSWSKVHFMFRPGLSYATQQVPDTSATLANFSTANEKTLQITGELEAEVFLAENFSVSASHGIGYESFKPADGGKSETAFFTLGNNFTNIGFHVYLFGK